MSLLRSVRIIADPAFHAQAFVLPQSGKLPRLAASRELCREILDSCRSTPGKATKSNVNPTISSRIPGQNEQGIGFGRAGNLINEQGKPLTPPGPRSPRCEGLRIFRRPSGRVQTLPVMARRAGPPDCVQRKISRNHLNLDTAEIVSAQD